jgi:hypothetical protein
MDFDEVIKEPNQSVPARQQKKQEQGGVLFHEKQAAKQDGGDEKDASDGRCSPFPVVGSRAIFPYILSKLKALEFSDDERSYEDDKGKAEQNGKNRG